MTSLTRGPKSHSRVRITDEQIRALLAMRRSGMTCKEVADQLCLGESTVARYSSSWFQKQGTKKPKRASGAKKVKVKQDTPEVKTELTSDQIDYINNIYRSGNYCSGTFIGNLFIRIGKFFGGHHSV
jgi:DNA-binding NarL/FixJ family response regulator